MYFPPAGNESAVKKLKIFLDVKENVVHLQSQTKEPTKEFPDKTVEDEVQAKVVDLAEVKEEVATSIRDRHSEAANFLNESMQTVFNDKKIIDENDIKLDKINDDLNDLLK